MPPKQTPKARMDNLVMQDYHNETLIYDLKTNRVFCLNETSALVFQLCDGIRTVSEISDLMSKKLKTLVKEEVIWLALDHLRKEHLLENSQNFEIDFKGLNRREIIKKVGLISMIALPVISSVVAPTSAFSASTSNCPPLGTCIPAGSVICPTGCVLLVNCQLVQAASNCGGAAYAPQPVANVNCATFSGFTFPPADCNVNLNPS